MKFLKQSLLTIFILSAILGTTIFLACEKDPCTNQSCMHGGSCGNGICTCPKGYDGPYCEYRTVDRFLGVFAGSTTCDNGAPVWDTAFVYADTAKGAMNVKMVMHTNRYDTLYGVASISQSVWSITLPVESDTNFYRMFQVTLQSNNKLSVNIFSDDKRNPNLEVKESCSFVGWSTQP